MWSNTMLELKNFNFLTSDESCKNDPTYQVICEMLSQMVRNGSIFLGAGYCISMSDMVRSALKHRGIDSKLVDCQLTFTELKDGNAVGNGFIGFPNVINPGEVDTHVVVVTSTSPSYLIDASLSKRLPDNRIAIIEPVKFNADNQFGLVNCTYNDIGLKATYQQKKTQIASYQHHMSIVERMETDRKIQEDIKFLTKLNYIGIGLSLFAVINVLLKATGFW
jgi:hypothetical protein